MSTELSPLSPAPVDVATVALAEELLRNAIAGMRPAEQRHAAKMARLMGDESGKALTLALADQIFRPPTSSRSGQRFAALVEDYGIADYLSPWEKVAMRLGQIGAKIAPELVIPAVRQRMRSESRDVILPASKEKLHAHIETRRASGMRTNINDLGEAVLGEKEAESRLHKAIERLSDNSCDYISVKLSAIYSQIDMVGHQHTLEQLKIRLRQLYSAALANETARGHSKFVNLDMEEYRDLELTCQVFMEVLSEEPFLGLEAGIVLQAYLPDAYPMLRKLTDFARRRVGMGGAGIKVRLVKGANLAMEKVDAELHDWPLAPYGSKMEVDANYKRMVDFACLPKNAEVVRIGIASHNLFDIAYAMVQRERYGVTTRIDFEMLEGMANHQARVVHKKVGDLLFYTPVVEDDHFPAAIAYLVRRLDENTSEENFLHDLFGMRPGNAAWSAQRERFLDAFRQKDSVFLGSRRTQDRAVPPSPSAPSAPFRNAPDTDWSLPANRSWLDETFGNFLMPKHIPLVINEEEIETDRWIDAADPSAPDSIPYRYCLAGPSLVERAISTAARVQPEWEARGIPARKALLIAAAQKLEEARGEALATMTFDAAKSIAEGDPEISEAVDFANYYARSLDDPALHLGCRLKARGVVVITPPWNFPFAIPCGGILAALMAGNSVIFKPAPETVATGWLLARTLWAAGIPQDVLQFVPTSDDEVGRRLIVDERVAAVVLTGSSETAEMFLNWRPDLRLMAETSGKNALIITETADPDLAIKDLVKSAFGHAGQKCSAASLAIVESALYDDPSFRASLKDAVESLIVGNAHNLAARFTPLIAPANDRLKRALKTLDEGEEWLVKPEVIDDNPCLWSPGVKVGVARGSWFHQTECFGPVLGIMRAEDLEDAIQIQNDSRFGLTGGIHSLDPAEIELWKDKVEVGNAYINRSITGAIVQRQPFGGWKCSAIGPGIKAGGPSYVSAMAIFEESGSLVEDNYSEVWGTYFSKSHDPTGLECESNILRYRPFTSVGVVAEGFTPEEIVLVTKAAEITGTELIYFETEKEAILSLENVQMLRCRAPGTHLFRACHQHNIRVATDHVLKNGRHELLHYLREQSISETLHRYGCKVPAAKSKL